MTIFLFEILLYLKHLGTRPPEWRLGPFRMDFRQPRTVGTTHRIESIGQPHFFLCLAQAKVEHLALLARLRVTKLQQYRNA